MAPQLKKALLTISVLTLQNLAGLEEQLIYLSRLLKMLPPPYRERVRVFVSDNASSDGSGRFLEEFSSAHPWLTYRVQKTLVPYDWNVLSAYSGATEGYVWFLAVDDYINDAKHIVTMLDLIDKYQPNGLTCVCAGEGASQPNVDASSVMLCSEITHQIRAISNAGKVSTNIVRVLPLPEEAQFERFLGKGYFHLTLLAWVQCSRQLSSIVQISHTMIRTKQNFGW